MRPLRNLIFTAMPPGRYVTANDVLNRLNPKPSGVSVQDVAQNLRHMVGPDIDVDRINSNLPVFYRRKVYDD